jgi:predicted Rossmann fold flavoprotein
MSLRRVVIAGGGAAGFMAAIVCAESSAEVRVSVLEKTAQFLSKVRISGGGRCNVTHACFDPVKLGAFYPRGGNALRRAFGDFQPRDTVAWFNARGVQLKTEPDGRMFPVTNSSETIIDCLLRAARDAGVELRVNSGLERVQRRADGTFALELSGGENAECERLMLATGGCRAAANGQLAVSLGHTLVDPVPSLFAFHIDVPWLKALAGISMDTVEVSAPGSELSERGAILVTHLGLSGPAILRLSAWGARDLHEKGYRFPLLINWQPDMNEEMISAELERRRGAHPARFIVNTPFNGLPGRLWEALVLAAGIARTTRWADLSRAARHQLVQQLGRTKFEVSGRSLNKDEFVTCGGVPLREVNFKTMESRVCPGLYFGGELLDIDGITGGFNFQSAWTTGWLAGNAMAAAKV